MKGDWADNWITESNGEWIVFDESFNTIARFKSYEEAVAALRDIDAEPEEDEDE